MIKQPVSIYINWAAYDELSDAVELTEALAMRQLAEMLRLRKTGVRFDCYLMDAFWYDPAGAYRTWRKPHWPQGPDRWLSGCIEHGIKPGMWFAGNTLCKLEAAPEWMDSLDVGRGRMCLFHGGFLPHWMETVRLWYKCGVRVFKLDFFQFDAAPEIVSRKYMPSEIRAMNIAALRHGLGVLREQCPELFFLGYNGFEEGETQSSTDIPFRKTVDPHWLDVFDSLYCGDPRPSDVPAMNFWRSKDVYTDHMVRVYQRNGFPLSRIDNAGFMIGTTGTCYFRNTAAWQGMLILSLARGGWANTYYGNLDLLSNEQGAWFGKVQSLFTGLQAFGRFATFGGIPGEGRPYGYIAEGANGALFTVVNPAQLTNTIRLPSETEGRILFQDIGHEPVLRDGTLTLGPEQMAVVGTGCFCQSAFDLGRQTDVRIPATVQNLHVAFQATSDKELAATLNAPPDGCVRIILRQFKQSGQVHRSSGGSPPAGIGLGHLLCIEAKQGNEILPLQANYDKAIWSGLSWAVAEFSTSVLRPGVPISVRCFSKEPAAVILKAELYHAIYTDRHNDDRSAQHAGAGAGSTRA
jgi:hypothetical protein